MCGCASSTGDTKSYSLNQPEASSTKAIHSSAKMHKQIPISKQLASLKALGKGSDLEKAVATAALVYDNAADTEGKLSKSEAKKLLQTQFVHFIQGQETKPKYQEIISALDENKDDQIDFEDFMVQLLSLTLMSDLRQEIQNVRKTK
ncbi:sentan [Hemicordylus capensis]|uniref:sentan n=1 Tax=Hemicordylus capensis TaxID=884348 RepID=UPI002301FEE9|nr:sentan [Hemicordylus capensis]